MKTLKCILNDEMHRLDPTGTLEHAVDVYLLELSRTFRVHAYFTDYFKRFDPRLPEYDDKLAKKMLGEVRRPTAYHTAALEELILRAPSANLQHQRRD